MQRKKEESTIERVGCGFGVGREHESLSRGPQRGHVFSHRSDDDNQRADREAHTHTRTHSLTHSLIPEPTHATRTLTLHPPAHNHATDALVAP
jgi:hypothetical protein